MDCEYQSLCFCEDGYIIKCKECGYFQIAFQGTMLVLNEADFSPFKKIISSKVEETQQIQCKYAKSVVIPTPATGIYLLLTRQESDCFLDMLEDAETEIISLNLMALFGT